MVPHRCFWNPGIKPAVASVGIDFGTVSDEEACRRQLCDGGAGLSRDGAWWVVGPSRERSDIARSLIRDPGASSSTGPGRSGPAREGCSICQKSERGTAGIETGRVVARRGHARRVRNFALQMIVDYTELTMELSETAAAQGLILPVNIDVHHGNAHS